MDSEHDVQKQVMISVIQCESCGAKFGRRSDLMYHMKEKHQILTKQCKYFARGLCHLVKILVGSHTNYQQVPQVYK